MKLFNKKITKKMIVALLVVAVSITAIGCSKKDDSESDTQTTSKSTLESIKAKGTLVVGTAPGYPPFEFIKSTDGKSEVVGADIDLANKVAEKLGVKLEIKTMDFDSLIPALVSDKIDMAITGMTPTDERKKTIDFSDVYFTGTNSLIVKADFNKKAETADDLKQLKIGVQKGSTQEILAVEKLKVPSTKSLLNIPDLVSDLKNGNIEAVIASSTVAKINEKQFEGIKVLDIKGLSSSDAGETAAIALKRGNNEELLTEVNSLIKELHDSGEYDKILNKNIDIAGQQNAEK
ncbi:transporter substrate-binding domain-containing protein [Peptostreptococcus porci]|uniref:transporter substrate-binding domain-containing protein n=1 Tax=Peptostreptococcus porci TaxID=2652282 RepID=UPI002A756D7A|nr:transporter substrate-binding domain-containing protein [Peptostreptococcus porci]MDY2794198.1 transporter substrate-binding domain-containing protein [Peptostreptococcus porci]MDY4127562.1 transporter substrate-binding domain-containing protein [Peptostreptococcus porci]MDY5436663.1 transporter substrate-binding domain-containing protein [Peptostreptococcus porci]